MTKATVEVLVDDLDGTEAVETVWLGWNGDWRELELSKKNLAALTRALDRYWNVSRPVAAGKQAQRRSRPNAARPHRSIKTKPDPKLIRVWATDNGIEVRARGRIPADVVRRYNDAHRRS
jgi:nucleoid-associated protein Lsr2